MQHFGQIKAPALVAGLVDRHLFETTDQLGRAAQIAFDNNGAFLQLAQKTLEDGAFQAVVQIVVQLLFGGLQRAGNHNGVTDGGVQFVGDAGHQGAQPGQFF